MKLVLCTLMLFALSASVSGQETLFLAAGHAARGSDLFMGATAKTTLVSTQQEFLAADPVPDKPLPSPVQAPVQAPKQAPMTYRVSHAPYQAFEYRQAPQWRGWAERRSERRASRRANRGGLIRGLLGC